MNKHFAVDKDDLQELAKMAHAVWLVIEAEQDAKRSKVLTDIFDMFAEILADVASTPITIMRVH
ncbi:MAG: hypothetical protein Q7J46_00045 [Pseudomonas sp.]|nr:hypothetical protein [Pseudomonas sp.]